MKNGMIECSVCHSKLVVPATKAVSRAYDQYRSTVSSKQRALNVLLVVCDCMLSKIKGMQKSGADVESLISGDTSHAGSWLIGRHVNTKKVKRTPKQVDLTHSEDYVNDLTAKIRVQLEAEMEEFRKDPSKF